MRNTRSRTRLSLISASVTTSRRPGEWKKTSCVYMLASGRYGTLYVGVMNPHWNDLFDQLA